MSIVELKIAMIGSDIAISGQSTLGRPIRKGEEIVRKEWEVLNEKICSRESKWRSMWPRVA
jgi:hypothetical protein